MFGYACLLMDFKQSSRVADEFFVGTMIETREVLMLGLLYHPLDGNIDDMRHFLEVKNSSLKYAKKHWFIFVVLAVYVFFTAYYMGPGFYKCSDSIYGFGDSTAGPIWRNSLKPEQPPFGGYQTSTNYPYGESTYSPVGFIASVQTVSMWAASKVVGPMCAYNLYNMTGYVLTALVMFAFIRYLTRNRWIALLAGYAVSFTPYVQGKVGGHPNYGYSALLIGILWLTIHTLETRRRWSAILLGVLLALSAYFDPYFILLAATIVTPAFLMWFAVTWLAMRRRNESFALRTLSRQIAKPIIFAIITFSILLSPLVAIRLLNAQTINQTVSSSRGNVVEAAMLCSNMPSDYLLPDPTNIHITGLLGPSYTTKNIEERQWCGYAESRVSVSITLITLVVIASAAILIGALQKRRGLKLKLPYRSDKTIAMVLSVGLAGLVIGLPPIINGMLMPSGVVLKITTMWRIFAREYLVVNMALVILAAIALYYIFSNYAFFKRTVVRAIVIALVFIGVLLEYQINNPFSPMTFSYERDIPSIYQTVKDKPEISVIAEYPMDRIGVEYDSVVYYMTMQAVHGKKLVNSILSTDSRMTTHVAMKDLSDPQTIPALRALGVRYVVVHGESAEDILKRTNNNLEIIEQTTPTVYALTMVRADDNKNIALLRIKDGVESPSILTIEKGSLVNLPLQQSPIASEFEVLNESILKKNPLEEATSSKDTICFDVKMSAPTDAGVFSVYHQGIRVHQVDITGTAYTRVFVSGVIDNESIRIVNDKGYNMRLNNLSANCQGDDTQ